MGNMASGYYYNVLSNNTCDIESKLYGIGSSNLVTGPKNVYPDLNKLDKRGDLIPNLSPPYLYSYIQKMIWS